MKEIPPGGRVLRTGHNLKSHPTPALIRVLTSKFAQLISKAQHEILLQDQLLGVLYKITACLPGGAHILVKQVVYLYFHCGIIIKELISQTHIPEYSCWVESCSGYASEVIVGEIISEDDIFGPVGSGFESNAVVNIFFFPVAVDTVVVEHIIELITRIQVHQLLIIISESYRRPQPP